MDEKEMYQVLGFFHLMEIIQLPLRRMYWETEEDGLFPGLNYGATMSRNRFEEIRQERSTDSGLHCDCK